MTLRRRIDDVRALIRRTIYGTLAARAIALLAVYALCRIIFYLANAEHFSSPDAGTWVDVMSAGMLFDLSAICYTNFLFFHVVAVPHPWWERRRVRLAAEVLFVLGTGVGIAANCFDFAYYPFTFKRTTSEIFAEFAGQGDLGGLTAGLAVDFWWVGALLLVLMAIVVLITKVLPLPTERFSGRRRVYYGTGALLFPVVSALVLMGCRGGWFTPSHRPITNSNAMAYVTDPEHAALVLNTPFSIIRTIDKDTLPEKSFFASERELAAVYTPVTPPVKRAGDPQPEQRHVNVVILIVESFAVAGIGGYNEHLEGYDGYTPFFDELMKECLVFRDAFSNGLRTIESLPPILASIPNLGQRFVLSHYYNNRIDGIGSLVRPMGYHTSFFHGAPTGSMGFDAFTRSTGFEEYRGMEDYGNDDDYDGAWGIWDEEFLQYFARELGGLPQPFLSVMFTLSSHSPFEVPDRYKGKFPTGSSRSFEVMGYTDFALRRFFETARTTPWFDNTLFVITADHGAAHFNAEYKSQVGRYRVPMLLCRANDPQLRGSRDWVVQHADIRPTVLRYIGYDGPLVGFGNDMLDPDAPHFAVGKPPWGAYHLMQDGWVMLHHRDERHRLHNYRVDLASKKNLLRSEPQRAERMGRLIEAIIQQHNHRMRENLLSIASTRWANDQVTPVARDHRP